MERTLLLLSVAVAMAGHTTRAQLPAAQLPTVTTNGSAQIRVVPDLADVCFEVEVRGVDLAAACKQQADRATGVLEKLRAAGITEAELQSSPVEITTDYTDRRQQTDTVQFYRVAQTISATLHDLKKIPDVTAGAVAAGATGVRGAGLRTSQLRRYRDRARAQAVHAAKDKAVALAHELGAKVGNPYTIVEGANPALHTSFRAGANVQSNVPASDPSDEPAPVFAPGMININADVTVTFFLN